MRTDFDAYANAYDETMTDSISFGGQEHAFFVEFKATHLLNLMRTRVGEPSSLRVLDVGCGIGLTDSYLLSEVKKLHGVDTAAAAVARASSTNPDAHYRSYAGDSLPYDDGAMDLTFAICVLHHVEMAKRARFIAEMRRVTRPGGLVAIYEHNPLNPLTRLAVSRCEFDQDAVLVGRGALTEQVREAGREPVVCDYILFFPVRSSLLALIGGLLRWLPLGAQHVVAARR